jgi:hypothetical protein
MASPQADAPTGEDKADRRAFPPRPLRILGSKFHRNVGTGPPLHAAGETGSEHGASQSRRVCRRARLAYQEPFVCVASAMDAAPDGASNFVCTEGSAGWGLGTEAVDCATSPRAARIAASILARTLRARRVRATNGRSTLAPVVQSRDFAVGPIASSAATQTTPKLAKIAPEKELTHCQNITPSAPNNTTGIISRHNHK